MALNSRSTTTETTSLPSFHLKEQNCWEWSSLEQNYKVMYRTISITLMSRVWPVNTFHQNNTKSHFNANKYIGCGRIGYLFRIYFTLIQ